MITKKDVWLKLFATNDFLLAAAVSFIEKANDEGYLKTHQEEIRDLTKELYLDSGENLNSLINNF